MIIMQNWNVTDLQNRNHTYNHDPARSTRSCNFYNNFTHSMCTTTENKEMRDQTCVWGKIENLKKKLWKFWGNFLSEIKVYAFFNVLYFLNLAL